ncbi:MAG: FAD-dependent oxidoreductase [Oscillospiraceae bacterium]|nr:FAD-dependent oxidoreductase [Oscillospiraceae bacterium]MBQ6973230.1 FAD-dependent oxidoreductase [Oscillospiraceae bacterium]
MKLVVVGGVAGGASVAARVRRLDEAAEIRVFERGGDVSYSNCSLPYYLGGVVASADDLVMMTPRAFKARHNIDVQVHREVVAIDRTAKTVTVRNTQTGETFTESYDKLVLAPGASPIMPGSIQGIHRDNVFSVRNVQDVVRIKSCLDAGVKDVVVVGGGFIGVECAENLKQAGKNVTIVEGLGQIMAPFDYDMVQYLHKELYDNGVTLCLNSTLTAVEDGHIVAKRDDKAFTLPADAVIMAIGVAPETGLARDAGLAIGITRGIKVNAHMQTTDPDIYAVGDVVETVNALTGQPGRLALAGPAQQQARVAANHICGIDDAYKGFIGSSCVRVFGLNAASTGLNERSAKAAGIDFDFVNVYPGDKVGIMPDAHYMAFKLLYTVPQGKLIGAQAIGRGDVTKRVDAVAAMISLGGTLEDLASFEHCYAPLFSTAKDVVNMAALVGLNVLHGAVKQVHLSDIRPLVESGAYIVDVREEGEFAAGHIKGAHNVPLSQLHQRLAEIPKDRPVYLHCRTSQRSYYAYRTLTLNGYDNVTNLSGSFLGLCLEEYFNDVTTGREPIVTAYNFR